MAAGDFTASNLVDVQLKADAIWMDNMAKTDYIADVEAFKALKENQSANVSTLETGKTSRRQFHGFRIAILKQLLVQMIALLMELNYRQNPKTWKLLLV